MTKLEPTRTSSDLTATERFRELLDERGVRWWQKKCHTCWKVSKGQEVEMWRAWEAPDGSLTLKVDYIYGLTPEQAIAATLGLGTCEVEESWHGESEMVEYHCTACDEYIAVEVIKPNGAQPPNFCPNCGRRCVG